MDSFPVCLRLADVVSVSKGCHYSDVGEYRSISINPFLSKVLENIVAGKLIHFLESNSLLPPSQFL